MSRFTSVFRAFRPAVPVLCLVLAVALLSACGKKGDPEPKDPAKAFTWKETSATSINYCINFSGTLSGAVDNLDSIRLDLSALDGPEDCPGCPFVPTETQMFSPSQAGFDPKTGNVSFTYCPAKAQAYRWKVSGQNVYRNLPHAATPEGLLIMVR